MLPPVSGPAATVKLPGAADAPQATQTASRGQANTLPAENGPAKMRPETLRAIDPARQSSAAPPLRTGRTDSNDPVETLPAGPPPAFVETLLERQAREAFEPNGPVEGTFADDVLQRVKTFVGSATEMSAPESAQPNRLALSSFAEIRAIARDATPPEVDRME